MKEEENCGNEMRANVNELFDEVSRVIAENFVATYQKEDNCRLTMRLPNGQQFKISVEEKQ